jgi:general secretion pathway protein G
MNRPNSRNLLRNRRGMSLVEVMVVIAIILVLMSVVGFGALSIFQSSKIDTTMLTMGEVNKRVEIYALKKGPPSTSEGLKSAFGGEDVPKDSWGNDFIYVSPGPNGAKYDLISYGSDAQEGGTGNAADIRWSEHK